MDARKAAFGTVLLLNLPTCGCVLLFSRANANEAAAWFCLLSLPVGALFSLGAAGACAGLTVEHARRVKEGSRESIALPLLAWLATVVPAGWLLMNFVAMYL